jgi:hypothetical protein
MKLLLACLSLVWFTSFRAQIKIDDSGDGWKGLVEQSLEVIKTYDSASYNRVIQTCNHIGFSTSKFSTIEGNSTILIGQYDINSRNIHDIAAAIVHESNHLLIQQRGIKLPEYDEEIACYFAELYFLMQIPGVEDWLIKHVTDQINIYNQIKDYEKTD